jgi:hypothetical protein
MMEE